MTSRGGSSPKFDARDDLTEKERLYLRGLLFRG